MPSDPPRNEIRTRDLWLHHATDALRPLFESHHLTLPASIRFAIAFTSTGRRSKRVGETWHAGAPADGAFEVFLRADLAEPIEVLTVLVRQLVHAALPAKESHGKRYKAAANRIGLTGRMREATPGPYLQERLERLANAAASARRPEHPLEGDRQAEKADDPDAEGRMRQDGR